MKAKDIIKLEELMFAGEPLRVCNSCGFEAMTKDDLDLMAQAGSTRAAFGRKNKCKKCRTKEYNEWVKNNPKRHKENTRKSLVKKRYGISLEEYEESMNTSVECEICGSDKKLRYDHNHSTGEFRGVLCATCNTGIGLLGDNPKTVEKALEYLKERGHYGES